MSAPFPVRDFQLDFLVREARIPSRSGLHESELWTPSTGGSDNGGVKIDVFFQSSDLPRTGLM